MARLKPDPEAQDEADGRGRGGPVKMMMEERSPLKIKMPKISLNIPHEVVKAGQARITAGKAKPKAKAAVALNEIFDINADNLPEKLRAAAAASAVYTSAKLDYPGGGTIRPRVSSQVSAACGELEAGPLTFRSEAVPDDIHAYVEALGLEDWDRVMALMDPSPHPSGGGGAAWTGALMYDVSFDISLDLLPRPSPTSGGGPDDDDEDFDFRMRRGGAGWPDWGLVGGGDDPASFMVTVRINLFHFCVIAGLNKMLRAIVRKVVGSVPDLEVREREVLAPLLLGSRVSVLFRHDPALYDKDDRSLDGMNAFHLAAKYNAQAIADVVRILKEAGHGATFLGPLLEARDAHLAQTPLHICACRRSTAGTRMLIRYGADVNATNYRGFSPLHMAAKAGSEANTLLLIDHGADVNLVGHRLKAPLHKARTAKVVQALLRSGADPFAKIVSKEDSLLVPMTSSSTATGRAAPAATRTTSAAAYLAAGVRPSVSLLTVLLRKNSSAVECLLDKGFLTNGKDLDSGDLLLVFDLALFYEESRCSSSGGSRSQGPERRNEIAAHMNLIRFRRTEYLSHPLVETFLHMKWDRVKRVFFLNVFFYVTFAFALSALAVMNGYLVKLDDASRGAGAADFCANHSLAANCTLNLNSSVAAVEAEGGDGAALRTSFEVLYFLVAALLATLGLREVMQAAYSWHDYAASSEDRLELLLILLTAGYLAAVRLAPRAVTLHLGAWCVFLAWIELTLLVGRFPKVGIYIYMFVSVIKTLLLFLLVYSPALFAFSLSFHLLLPNSPVFDNPASAALKTLAMMTGELDFADTFTWDSSDRDNSHFSTQVLFALFVVFVSIIIVNLLVGLTVSEIDQLYKQAGIVRLQKTVFQISVAERVLTADGDDLSGCGGSYCRSWFLGKSKVFQNLQDLRRRQRIRRSFGCGGTSPWLVCIQPNAENGGAAAGTIAAAAPSVGPGLASRLLKASSGANGGSGGSSGGSGNNGGGSSSEHHPIYFYDEFRGAKTHFTGYYAPQWVVDNSLVRLKDRRQQQDEESGASSSSAVNPDEEQDVWVNRMLQTIISQAPSGGQDHPGRMVESLKDLKNRLNQAINAFAQKPSPAAAI